MREQEASIDVFDEKGRILVSKKRSDIDKRQDILKAVYVLVMNEKK